MSGTPMDKAAAARIQAASAKNNQPTGKDSFPARAQAAADKNVNAGQGNAGQGK